MFVVNILGQDNYEIVAMATVLRQGLLQRGHDVRRQLQTDDVVGDRESQFDCLDQDLTRTLRATTGQHERGEENTTTEFPNMTTQIVFVRNQESFG